MYSVIFKWYTRALWIIQRILVISFSDTPGFSNVIMAATIFFSVVSIFERTIGRSSEVVVEH